MTGDSVIIEDLESKNGTFLGEAKVSSRAPVRDGDRLRIGSVPLQIRIFPNPETTETAARSTPASSGGNGGART